MVWDAIGIPCKVRRSVLVGWIPHASSRHLSTIFEVFHEDILFNFLVGSPLGSIQIGHGGRDRRKLRRTDHWRRRDERPRDVLLYILTGSVPGRSPSSAIDPRR